MADLFKRLTNSINRLTKTIRIKLKTIIETNKLKDEISTLKKTQTEHYHGIGKKVHEMHKMGQISIEEFQPLFVKLTEIDSLIDAKEKEIQSLVKKEETALEIVQKIDYKEKNSREVIEDKRLEITMNTIEDEIVLEDINDEFADKKICECGYELNKEDVFCSICGKKVG